MQTFFCDVEFHGINNFHILHKPMAGILGSALKHQQLYESDLV